MPNDLLHSQLATEGNKYLNAVDANARPSHNDIINH
jgi:hypothetical protein